MYLNVRHKIAFLQHKEIISLLCVIDFLHFKFQDLKKSLLLFVFTGYGVFALKTYNQGEFLLEYKGDLQQTSSTEPDSCFKFYFKHDKMTYWYVTFNKPL